MREPHSVIQRTLYKVLGHTDQGGYNGLTSLY